MKITILFSKINMHQNASIVTCYQKFPGYAPDDNSVSVIFNAIIKRCSIPELSL